MESDKARNRPGTFFARSPSSKAYQEEIGIGVVVDYEHLLCLTTNAKGEVIGSYDTGTPLRVSCKARFETLKKEMLRVLGVNRALVFPDVDKTIWNVFPLTKNANQVTVRVGNGWTKHVRTLVVRVGVLPTEHGAENRIVDLQFFSLKKRTVFQTTREMLAFLRRLNEWAMFCDVPVHMKKFTIFTMP